MPNPTILIVDGHEDSRLIYQAALEHHRYRVVATGRYDDGLPLARASRPELICVSLPPLPDGGWGVARHFREDAATREIPLLALSTTAGADGSARAREIGCAGFLVKPCRPLELVREIERLLPALQ